MRMQPGKRKKYPAINSIMPVFPNTQSDMCLFMLFHWETVRHCCTSLQPDRQAEILGLTPSDNFSPCAAGVISGWFVSKVIGKLLILRGSKKGRTGQINPASATAQTFRARTETSEAFILGGGPAGP